MKYKITLEDWKEIPISFNDLSSDTIKKVIDLCREDYKIKRKELEEDAYKKGIEALRRLKE